MGYRLPVEQASSGYRLILANQEALRRELGDLAVKCYEDGDQGEGTNYEMARVGEALKTLDGLERAFRLNKFDE